MFETEKEIMMTSLAAAAAAAAAASSSLLSSAEALLLVCHTKTSHIPHQPLRLCEPDFGSERTGLPYRPPLPCAFPPASRTSEHRPAAAAADDDDVGHCPRVSVRMRVIALATGRDLHHTSHITHHTSQIAQTHVQIVTLSHA